MEKGRKYYGVRLNGYQQMEIAKFVDMGLFATPTDFIRSAVDSKIQELNTRKIELKKGMKVELKEQSEEV